MTAFKTALAAAVASIAVALGATALTSAPASAKFLPLTHLPPVTQANPGAVPVAETAFDPIAAATKSSTKVPIISLIRFAPNLRIAGAVQKQASFSP